MIDPQGKLSIAKFPSPANDEWDVMRWEAVALQLARDGGIDVAAGSLHTIDGRFVHVLERADGEGGSYLEIADVTQPPFSEGRRRLARTVAPDRLLDPDLELR